MFRQQYPFFLTANANSRPDDQTEVIVYDWKRVSISFVLYTILKTTFTEDPSSKQYEDGLVQFIYDSRHRGRGHVV